MSDTTQPIAPARFAAALKDLTLASIYAKVSEIRNSIAHLRRSNAEMQPFVDAGDADFAGHIWDNLAVIGRNEERLDLLRAEVEERGYIWHEEEGDRDAGEVQPGRLSPPDSEMPSLQQQEGEEEEQQEEEEDGQPVTAAITHTESNNDNNGGGAGNRQTRRQGGSLDDAELARRLAERLQEDLGDDDDDDGVHL